ncbi:MAG: hypothetical protein H0T65_25510 [Deltaproteobacteria bacterium]|nr:hypothetical protein [Deltaproteobacteria bacterium]
MNQSDPAQIETARRLLAHEGAAGGADKSTTTAGRVYDKLTVHLGPLVGGVCVQLLFARSAKLTQGELASFAAVTGAEGSRRLREFLETRPPLSPESAAVLFGTFFTLINRFIGERLTTEALRSAWPMFDMAPAEKTK